MSTRIYKFICVAFATLGMLSCTAQSNVGNLKFKEVERKDSVVLGETAALNIELSISYPVSGDKELIDWLNKELSKVVLGLDYNNTTPDDVLNKTVETTKQAYIEEVKEFYDEDLKKVANGTATEVGSWYNYEVNISASPTLYKGNLLNYLLTAYHYTGGAHGITNIIYFPIDLEAKKIIKYADLFKADDDKALTKLIIEQIKIDNETTNLNESGFWVDEIKPSKNFGISEQGILFFYNQYEIAPYAMGPIEVLIPYSKLKGLINDKHPVIKRLL